MKPHSRITLSIMTLLNMTASWSSIPNTRQSLLTWNQLHWSFGGELYTDTWKPSYLNVKCLAYVRVQSNTSVKMKISWTTFGHPFAVWIIYKSHNISSSILTPWPLISFSILILFFNLLYLDPMQVYPKLVCPLSWWCHPTISSSVTHFSSCTQSLPASGSLPISWLFTSGGQITGASASASLFLEYFIFLGSKITVDSDCNQEIKWHLLLGRKAMTNLDSVSKCSNLTLLTEVHIVKAMDFLGFPGGSAGKDLPAM